MKRYFVVAVILLAVFLTGCLESAYRMGAPITERGHATTQTFPEASSREFPQKSEPAPVPSRVEQDQEVQIAIYTPPPRFKAKPVASAAVSDLIRTAKRQKNAGDMVGAAATMERALRIEPRNAHLWNQLAEVRLSQRQYSQAEDLAAKSNALAAADSDLRRNNWLLIAKARRSVGNILGARFAENKASIPR